MSTHLIISDGQVKPGTDLDHWFSLGKLACNVRPDVIINIGDFWDMPSLSSWDKGKMAAENRRYEADIDAGNEAMEAFLSPLIKQKKKLPEMHFTLGNHENRIERYVESNPVLEGKLSYNDLNLSRWHVHDFLKPVSIDGVSYAHYFYNPHTGKPHSGTIQNKLKSIGCSFTQGHLQALEWTRKELANGKTIMGMVTGAYYQHDETYKGPQGNHHWRGVVVKRNVTDGQYDFETWNIKRVLREFN